MRKRFASHALVEIKKYKWLPFNSKSGLILDLSLEGVKIEFNQSVKSNPKSVWISIPLTPFGLSSPDKITCQVEVRWFDEKNSRIGGLFKNLSEKNKFIMSQIIQIMKAKGKTLV